MSFTLPSTLFSSKSSFAQMLPSLIHQKAFVVLISQHLTTKPALFQEFGLIFLRQLVDETLDVKPIVALSCFNTYFVEYLADSQQDLKDVVNEARSIMFSYCLKIRNTRQDLDDIEIYHVLYSVLDQCAPSFSLSWQNQLDLLSLEKSKNILQKYDDLIECYIENPGEYPAEFSDYNEEEQEMDTIIRSSLFNTLFESKMKPLQFKNDKRFAFSDAWIRLLKHALNSPLHAKFNVVVQLTENSLWNLEADDLHVQTLHKAAFDSCPCAFTNQQEFEKTFRECLQSLQVAHPRYISLVVYSLIQLIHHARISYNDDNQNSIDQMSQAMWFEMYQSLLSDAVFETLPCEKSPTMAKLFKVAACYIQFRYALQIPHTDFPMSIWDHYYLQRSIFLKATHTTDNIALIEKVVFTSNAQ